MTTKPKINSLIENSGIVTHYKVIDFLRNKGWGALISSYYYDNVSNTTKEIDIIAEKQFNSAGLASHSSLQINVQLFLECKYISQEIVFWFDEIDKNRAVPKLEWEKELSILYGRKMSADISPEAFHYLRADKAVKIFSANLNKEDVMYKALTQCLNAQIYHMHWNRGPLVCPFSSQTGASSRIIRYPVIVCDNFNKLLEVELQKNGKYSTKSINNNFLIETNYAHPDMTGKLIKNKYFLVDVVDFNYLGILLNEIEEEAKFLMEAYLGKDKFRK